MSERRGHARLCEEIRRELSDIMEFELRDPALKENLPTVMKVGLSEDGRYARVYVAIAEKGTPKNEVAAALHRDRGFFRTELAHRLSLRYTPYLEFLLDETMEKAMHLERLLQDEAHELGTG